MATLQSIFPEQAEFSSPERLANHISLMRKLKGIVHYARYPGRDASLFPAPPAGCNGEEQAAQWRLQSILMNAEVRYPMYLKLLESRMLQSRQNRRRQEPDLVVPPWDVAIVFYAHMLAPFNYRRDINQFFPKIWKGRAEFPIARMLASDHDDASEAAWSRMYPSTPYRVLTLNDKAVSISSSTYNAVDIRYYCSSAACKAEPARVIRMADWVKYRIGTAGLACPSCRTVLPRSKRGAKDAVLQDSQGIFGMPIFNLWDSPLRQFCKDGFVDRVLALPPLPSNAVERYLRFLQLIKETGETVVPTLDIDLCWHTHQLAPFAYTIYCVTHVGRQVNHDDTIRTETRSSAQDMTAKLWAIKYGESYFDPTNKDRSDEIKLRSIEYEQTIEKKAVELEQFDKDVLRKDLQQPLALAQAKVDEEMRKWATEEDSASAMKAQVQRTQAAMQGIKPAIQLFSARFYRNAQRKELKRLERQLSSEEKEYHDRHQAEAVLKNELYSHWMPLLNECNVALAVEADKRRTVQLLLEREVNEAEARCWKREVDGQLKVENYYDAQSWYSIVPSEEAEEEEAAEEEAAEEEAAVVEDAVVEDAVVEDADGE
ncbi:hypothetical protein LEL_06839 [Akanthomyces lecanii RCEF 1005]|uniref:Uncharacterized protein n=1 Tax=Akanthomyces lecanii RCEF 1005 TaxID=1081108 RepID=A0A168F9G8_CORDF|nr:hypothetical protein LEL_06839 [Akanthomyces lecanii RCEF 1005]